MINTSTIENIPANSTKPGIFSGVSPKLSFIFGLVTGVAVVSLIALILTTNSQNSLKSNKVANAVNDTNQEVANQDNKPTKVKIALKDSDYIRGNKNAPVVLIEYLDLECPYCKTFHSSMKTVLAQYSDKIAWVSRHFPLSFHANAQKEAEAAECVGKLGGADKYWNYIDKVFERTTSNGTGFALADLPKLAVELGLNKNEFTTCLDSGEFAAKVQTDLAEGVNFGVQGTPTTFINGQPVEGAVSADQLKNILDQVLAAKK